MTTHPFPTEREINAMQTDKLQALMQEYEKGIAEVQSNLHRAQRVAHKMRCELRRRNKAA